MGAMRILVVGAGAVGGYFGARLMAAGRDVTLLVREGRAAQIREHGLQVISPFGDLHLQPKLVTAAELRANPTPYDLILLSTKAYSLEAAMEDFAPAVGAQTSILPLLNGMRHLEAMEARFGAHAVLGGSTRIVSDMDAEGRIHQLEPLHDVVFGERDKSVTPRIQAIAAALHGANFDDKLAPDVLAFMWQKWVFLAALGGITCLMRGSIGEVAAAPGGLETAAAILDETDAIATANGYPTPQAFLENTRSRVLKKDSPLTASMYRDLERGAAVEADQILGDLIRRGKEKGVAAPLVTAAYAQLSVYSARRSKG
ncbi:ketopantoate reductase [Bryocella elongata]|uniref:2-dehydropantoate 2-reductase n=2 Tax=Bryocella elongata TaxID=863522 RepID=A0A1H6BI17_9BACT|nr:ketopantoate reductase [Bryocella elongata]